MEKRRELGEFLKSRRSRVQPGDVGLQSVGRRRVPGLRREELAQLAGVSVDYYVRLEQGRAGHPSEDVLEAIARALRLDAAELHDLIELARPVRTRRRAPRPERVRPNVQTLLDALDAVPAMVMGRRMDVLAWNRLAAALVVDWGSLPRAQRNAARHVFLDEGARRLYRDWEPAARDTVGYLRVVAGPPRRRRAGRPHRRAVDEERGLPPLAGQARRAREDARHQAPRPPARGRLTLSYESLALQGDVDQLLVTYTAEPGSESDTALRLLGAMAESEIDRPGAPSTSRG